jgi:hypothetical protein
MLKRMLQKLKNGSQAKTSDRPSFKDVPLIFFLLQSYALRKTVKQYNTRIIDNFSFISITVVLQTQHRRRCN